MQVTYNGHTIISTIQGFTVAGSNIYYPKTVEGLVELTEALK